MELLELLKNTKNVEIDGQIYEIDYKVTCDYKMLLILFGKKAANADDACVYCRVHLRDPPNVEANYPIFRTLKDTPDNLNPILNFIEYKNVIPDFLHLFLRLTDSLYKLLLMKLAQMDNDPISTDLTDRPNLKIFIDFLIHSCKITNPYYVSTQTEEKILFRHFTGNERMRIFKEIFVETDEFNEEGERKTLSMQRFYPNIINKLYNFKYEDYVWSNFYKLYIKIKKFHITPFDPTTLEPKLKKWLKAFLKISKLNRNFSKIGPYHHIFTKHLIELMQIHGDINSFNTQGLEKLNGFCIKYYHSCTSKKNTKLKYLEQLINKRNRMEFIFSNGDYWDFEHEDEDDHDYDFDTESISTDSAESDSDNQ